MIWADTSTMSFNFCVFGIAPNNSIAPAPVGTKEGYCINKALKGLGQDLIGYDIASAIANKLDNWFASAEGLQGSSGQSDLGLPSVPGIPQFPLALTVAI